MSMKLAEHNLLRMKAEAYLARAPRLDSHGHAPLRILQRPKTTGFPANGLQERNHVSEKPCILIVDSGPATAQLSQIIARAYRIQRVPSTAHVLETTRRSDWKPDLILLDIRKGLEICRRLKSDETTESIPVMLIIDRNHAEDEAHAFEVGADDCIIRPFRLSAAEARIRNQIRRKIKNDLLERYANQDGLTGVANRRCFDLMLDAEWRRAIRNRQQLSLVMMDVDCFKQFNDLYGHREGDHCLRQVANAMAQTLTRPGDLLARYGGEEFTAILPGTDIEGAHWMAERLRTAVMDLHIPQQRSDGAGQVSISVGCASMHPSARLAHHSLLQAADERLYLAKHSGRNCVR